VTHLAVDRDDVLIVLAADQHGGPAAFEVVEDAPRLLPARASGLASRFACNRLVVDKAGRLHLGSVCATSSDAIFDLQGLPVAEKDKVAPLLYGTVGTYLSAPLDSRKRGCVWHRVQLVGTLPARTAIEIQTTTSDVELDAGELADLDAYAWSDPVSVRDLRDGMADALIRSPPGRYLWLRLILTGDGHAAPAISRIVVEFPRVSLRRYLPGVFGMDPLGADFTDRFTAIFDTTLRSIETRVDTMHELFDPATAPAERPPRKSPQDAPTIDFLSWLAGWIGVTLDRQWPESTRRALLKRLTCSFGLRGTRLGLWQLLLTFLGFDRRFCEAACAQLRCVPRPLNCAAPPKPCASVPPPLILEHFRLRRWLFVGAGRLGDDATLWGKRIVNRSELSGSTGRTGNARVGPLECPPDRNPATQLISTPDPLRDPFLVYAHRFSVFVPARVRHSEWQRRGLERLLAQEAPAHTQWQIEYVEPRFRIGVQASIGLNSVIARVPAGLRLNDNALGRGTVLPPRPSRAPTVGISARVGGAMRLT
jgi:phage tail-like protein